MVSFLLSLGAYKDDSRLNLQPYIIAMVENASMAR